MYLNKIINLKKIFNFDFIFISNFVYFKNINRVINLYLGYFDCLNICNYNINIFKFLEWKIFFISLNLKYDDYFKFKKNNIIFNNILFLRFINTKFKNFFIKKINFFYQYFFNLKINKINFYHLNNFYIFKLKKYLNFNFNCNLNYFIYFLSIFYLIKFNLINKIINIIIFNLNF